MKRVDSLPAKNQKSINDASRVSGENDQGETRHYVQFYESDSFLVSRVADFVASAFKTDGAAIIIATHEHRSGVEQLLSERGVDIAELAKANRYISIDAKETLDRFMSGSSPDPQLFNKQITTLLDKATNGRRRHVWAFGEMVALLSAEKSRSGNSGRRAMECIEWGV